MTMAPHLEGHEIAFNASDRKSWKKYTKSMDEYLKRESRRGGGVYQGWCKRRGGQMRMLNLFEIKGACNELILVFVTFVPLFFPHLVPAGHAGKGSPFVGRVQPFNSFLFLSPPAFVKLP